MVILINFYDFYHVWYFSVFIATIKREGILLSVVFVLGIKMKRLDKNKKRNNSIVTIAATLFTLATIIVLVSNMAIFTLC